MPGIDKDWAGLNSDSGNRTASALLERIVDAPRNLVILESAREDELIEDLRLLARRSGQSLYLWREGAGLRSLRDGGTHVQVDAGLADALRFIRRSMHFGIYLMQLDAARLTVQNVNALVEIGRVHEGPARRVVLFGSELVVDPRLAPLCLHLRVNGGQAARPRLRDGRWVS